MKKASIFDEKGREIYLFDFVEPGDTVYYWNGDFGTILDYRVDSVNISGSLKNGLDIRYEASVSAEGELLDDIDFESSDISKVVFLTKEECEADCRKRMLI